MIGGKCGSHGWCKILIRALLAAVFIYAGYGKLTNIAGTAGYIASVGLPYATGLAWLSGLIEVIAGALLVAGFWKRYAAWALILFTIVATYFFHLKGVMAGDGMQIVQVLKNLAIIGGLSFFVGCHHKCGSCANCGGGTCSVCGASAKDGQTKCAIHEGK